MIENYEVFEHRATCKLVLYYNNITNLRDVTFQPSARKISGETPLHDDIFTKGPR